MLILFKIERTFQLLPETKNRIDEHLDAASMHHKKAAYYLKEGDYEKVVQHATIAKKYLELASKNRREEEYARERETPKYIN